MTETTKNSTMDNSSNVKRNFKARLFEMLYRQKPELLELYNAIHHTNYDNPDLLEINTLENALYISMHNDVSFIIDSNLGLYEHQSTENPNLPLRYLFYVADLYSAITKDDNIYGTRMISLPTPEFITFYNGEMKMSDSQTLRLSDAFMVENGNPSLELKVTVLNINPGHNQKLMDSCKSLRDYATYTSMVREYIKVMPKEEAVMKAIRECIDNDILADFLSKNWTEAIKVSIYEFDEAKYTKLVREEGRLEGFSEGEDSMAKLAEFLLSENRLEDFKEALADKEKRTRLFQEAGIKR